MIAAENSPARIGLEGGQAIIPGPARVVSTYGIRTPPCRRPVQFFTGTIVSPIRV